LGQIYARALHTGILLIALSQSLELLVRVYTRAVPPGPLAVALALPLIAVSLVVRFGAAWDAGRRIRRGLDRARPNWKGSTCVAAILGIALMVAQNQLLYLGWRAFNIPSGSNFPTLMVGDYIFADAREPGQAPAAGDMVVFRSPRDPSIEYVKRVVGLPGDRVRMTNGQLFINGQAARLEPTGVIEQQDAGNRFLLRLYFETLPDGRHYKITRVTNEGMPNNTQEFIIPPDHFFVLGDNRDNSVDSRFLNQIGYIPLADLLGKAETIFWSRDRSRILSRVD
jgi:signal peptidase I